MNNETLLIMDRNAIKYAPIPYEINKQEYTKLYPEMMHSRKLSFILKYEKPQIIPKIEALLLIKKFDNLYLIDKNHEKTTATKALKELVYPDEPTDDLNDMGYAEILKLASKSYGLNNQTFHSMKGVDLKREIRRLRSEELKEEENEAD